MLLRYLHRRRGPCRRWINPNGGCNSAERSIGLSVQSGADPVFIGHLRAVALATTPAVPALYIDAWQHEAVARRQGIGEMRRNMQRRAEENPEFHSRREPLYRQWRVERARANAESRDWQPTRGGSGKDAPESASLRFALSVGGQAMITLALAAALLAAPVDIRPASEQPRCIRRPVHCVRSPCPQGPCLPGISAESWHDPACRRRGPRPKHCLPYRSR